MIKFVTFTFILLCFYKKCLIILHVISMLVFIFQDEEAAKEKTKDEL